VSDAAADEVDPLDFDLPAQPAALAQLSVLMADDDVDLKAAATLVESDMALAAAMLKAVNSSFYGLKGRVQSVLQALQYLGLREVSAMVYEMAVRAAFPHDPLLDGLWSRAARRSRIMGRLGQRLGTDSWLAHSAGLFEESGKAVLMRHAPDHYPAMLRATAGDDLRLVELERVGFGATHAALGALLTQRWGLSPAAVDCVRHHLALRGEAGWPATDALPPLLLLSALAHALLEGAPVEPVAERWAAAAGLEAAQVLRAVGDVRRQLDRDA
jgi:HD-like signal output (HDOD) protein